MLMHDPWDLCPDFVPASTCSFGLLEGVGFAITALAGGLADAGISLGMSAAMAGTIAEIAAPALVYGGLGAAGSALTGGDPLVGALTGGLTGGLAGGGAGGALGSLFGQGAGFGNTLIGAGVGALGSGLSGGNPLMGALSGGLSSYIGSGGFGSAEGAAGGGLGTGEALYGPPPTPPDTVPAGTGPAVTDYGSTEAATRALGAGYPDAPPMTPLANAAGAAGRGGGGILNNPSVALGALSALSSLMNKPQQGKYPTPGPSSNAANLGPYYNASLKTDAPGRTATNAQPANWYTYGQIPGGLQFFKDNSLRNYGFRKGGALSVNDNEYSTDQGPYVRGPGDGQSDEVPARLSDGEYVLRADEVAALGNGSNEAGARKLDAARDRLAQSMGRRNRNAKATGGGALSSLLKVA